MQAISSASGYFPHHIVSTGMMMMSSDGGGGSGRQLSMSSRHRPLVAAASHAHRQHHHRTASNEGMGSSSAGSSSKHLHKHQQQALPSTITTLASPTSSASSSICSSPPSSSSCSSCSECDDEAHAQASLLHVSDEARQQQQQQGRHPRNSTSIPLPSSSCRHSRHAAHHHHRQHTSHSSLSNSGHHHQADQQLFSPITSNGSVISSESSSKSRPASPLKSSVSSILPSAEQERPAAAAVSRANVQQQPETTVKDGENDTTASSPQQKQQDIAASTSSSVDMVVDDAPSTTAVASTEITSSLQQEAPPRPLSNPRKSARRHSENGMTTPDEAFYSSSSAYLPFTSNTSIPVPSAKQRDVIQDTFIAPSMYSRTASTPASSIQYQHPGTPAITGTSSSSTLNQPLQASVPTMIQNPGERRIQNEETRPARRKVHRIDTSSISFSSSVSAYTTPSAISGQQGRSYSTPALSRKMNDRTPVNKSSSSTTFLHHQRPSPHSDSYFPQSSSQVAQTQIKSRSSTSNSASNPIQQSEKEHESTPISSSDHQLEQRHQQQRPQEQGRASQKRDEESKRMKKLKQIENLRNTERNMEHMDIANHPTLDLLQMLASLLSKITAKNDAIRDGVDQASPSPSASSGTDANADVEVEKEGEVSQDEQMEGNDAESQQDSMSGTTTPPSQVYSHSGYSANEPVTPAVPFSSPALSREASHIPRDGSKATAGDGKGDNAQEEDLFEHDSRLTVSSAEANSIIKSGDAGEAQKMAKSVDGEKEDSSLQPRHNFYRPPPSTTIPSSSSVSSSATALAKTEVSARNNQTRSIQSHTILTSAANALAMPNATLCFHARNIPSISIEAYLIRISKYCPTTNEVFISLLVYFDRMSRLPNLSNLTSSLPSSSSSTSNNTSQISNNSKLNSVPSVPSGENSSSNSSNSEISTGTGNPSQANVTSHIRTRSSSNPPESSSQSTQHSHHSTFAVDSFNIHRLIIAGVTVASKFFSDVFYTNSRYAKVGGLPLTELNALELQFLLLNGFDLIVSPEELQRYADYLLTGALPPLASDSSDRFGSRPSTSLGAAKDGLGRDTTTPVDTPPASRANTPSRTPYQKPSITGQSLFGMTMKRNMMQQEQQAITMPLNNLAASSNTPANYINSQPANPLRSTVMDNATRPKTSSRSASESSTSASEASTVVPSESSVDTERGEVDHSTADEDTGLDDDDEIDGDSRMTDVSGVPSPAVTSQSHSFSQYHNHSPKMQQQPYQKESLPVNATLGADRDGFAVPARPRPPLSRTSSGGNGQRHPLLATSTGSRTPSNGGSSGGNSSGGKTSAATSANHNINVKGNAGKASTTKGTASMHRRDNSRTREWTMQQQQQIHLHNATGVDEDAEMADQE